MSPGESRPLDRETLLGYFRQAAVPRAKWLVGMELEKMGRRATTGTALPYDGADPSVLGVLRWLREQRGGDPIFESDRLIGIDAPWGTISLEPGGQVEWSSRPCACLDELNTALADHLQAMRGAAAACDIRWLEEAVDPELPLDAMRWMPKARYKIMRPYLGARGRLAHRMMTQTASIQCAFDYSDEQDWIRKFRASSLVSPLAVALFANSKRIDGRDAGYASYRQAIWRETDPERCGLPGIVFDRDFGFEMWLDWVLRVPTMFVHRARGLLPVGGVPFGDLLARSGCTAVKQEDWETHISTVFTEVRSYDYIEVRSADLQSDELALAVPAFWTGILYHEDGIDAALELGRGFGDVERWTAAMETAAGQGLAGRIGSRTVGELASEALSIAVRGLKNGAACAGDTGAGVDAVERLAAHRRLALAA